MVQPPNLGGHSCPVKKTGSDWEGVPDALEEEYERKVKGFRFSI
jgi:hypothetical protein